MFFPICECALNMQKVYWTPGVLNWWSCDFSYFMQRIGYVVILYVDFSTMWCTKKICFICVCVSCGCRTFIEFEKVGMHSAMSENKFGSIWFDEQQNLIFNKQPIHVRIEFFFPSGWPLDETFTVQLKTEFGNICVTNWIGVQHMRVFLKCQAPK